MTTFKTMEEALELANDTVVRPWQAGAGVVTVIWPIRWDAAFRRGAWTNCYHAYPAHAAFGGDKNSQVSVA
ncbi:hypothetical protein ACLB1M_28140 [Escherichia coli]